MMATASSTGPLASLGAALTRALPGVHTYEVFMATVGGVLSVASVLPDNLSRLVVADIAPDTLPAIELSRPGYAPTAQAYLDAGHVGFAVWCEGGIAAMTWLFYNKQRRRQRVTYYPLDPGRAWLHASWTHPAFRRRGFHRGLIVHRIRYLQAHYGDVLAEANVELGNGASLHNWLGCGFARVGRLYLLSAGRVQYAWKRIWGPG